MNNKIATFLLLVLPMLAWAQPGLKPLECNPVLIKHKTVAAKHAKALTDTILSLPILEDFSGGQLGYPDASLFIDSNVYVNPNFCIGPPTIGCATFDGLNGHGHPYSEQSSSQDYADYLTSRPIHLDSVAPADSVYFSFLYQPQGFGEGVEGNDRIELQFFDNTLAPPQFVTVWQSEAGPLDTFKLVMVPILDTKYFSSNFKFRFRNFGAMYGMFDIWNIDYIYLDKGRHFDDTTFKDVGFVYKAPTMLKRYQHMPYSQYISNIDYFGKIKLTQTNISKDSIKCNYRYYGDYNQIGPLICDETLPNLAGKQAPVYTGGYNSFTGQSTPSLNGCGYPAMTQETEYKVTHVFQAVGDTDIIKSNDTIIYHQIFSDYYAFDDGTAEASYFVGGSNAEGAIRISLNNADTLRAVHFYFVQSYIDNQNKEFSLRVWNASATDPDKPGDVIYEKPLLHPVWQDSLNDFFTYYIDDTLLTIPANQNFFVGWYQHDSYAINIGFDRNTDHSDIAFTRTSNGEWSQSPYKGSLMIRPAIGGADVSPMGISEPKHLHSLTNVYLYPNPANTVVNISNYIDLGAGAISYTLYNLQGEVISGGKVANGQIDVSALQNGFYFVTLNNTKGQSITRKLIITR